MCVQYDRIFEEGEAGGATAGLIKISLGDVEFPEDSGKPSYPSLEAIPLPVSI